MVVVQVRAAPREFKLNFKIGGGVKTRDIVVLTRQFATMINAGLPLVQALDILAQQTENKILADTTRSEEHTSELQSRLHLVCRLLLEKKKTNIHHTQLFVKNIRRRRFAHSNTPTE